jgi:hypothetical protein
VASCDWEQKAPTRRLAILACVRLHSCSALRSSAGDGLALTPTIVDVWSSPGAPHRVEGCRSASQGLMLTLMTKVYFNLPGLFYTIPIVAIERLAPPAGLTAR